MSGEFDIEDEDEETEVPTADDNWDDILNTDHSIVNENEDW